MNWRDTLKRPNRIEPMLIAALVACASSLAYAGMKAVMAVRGELGLPGFPASASSYEGREGISGDEWALAGTGLMAAAVALLPILPPAKRLNRWLVAIPVWFAALSQAAGAAGFTLRAFRIMPDLGVGPQGPVTWIVLAVLDAGAIAWLALAVLVVRR